VAVIAVWLDQAFYLWPLPPEVAARSSSAGDPNAVQALSWWESQLWLSWITRVIAIPIGLLSGALVLRNHHSWPIVLLAVSIVSFFAFRAWQWLFMFVPLFTSTGGALGGSSWVLERPQFVVNSLVFPAMLVVAATCSAIVMKQRRAAVH